VTAGPFLTILVCLIVLILSGCSIVRDWIVDDAAGLPVSDLIEDVRSSSSEYEEEQHEKRVEELSSEYEDFVRSKEAGEVQTTEPVSLVKKKRKDESTDSEYVPNHDLTD
jgi:hypothetical protein